MSRDGINQQSRTTEPGDGRSVPLLGLCEAIARHNDLPSLFRDLPEHLRQVVKFDLLYILLHDPVQHVFRLHLLEGKSDGLTSADHEFSSDTVVAGWGLHTLQPVVIADLEYEATSSTPTDFLLERRVKSVCTLSLDTARGRLGAIAVGSAAACAYTQKDIQALRLVAAQVAAAINNAIIVEYAAALQEHLVREGSRLGGSREWWRPVFDNSIIGVVLSDPTNARILAANEVYQKMVGYTEEELRTMTFLDITPEEDRDWNWALNIELREGKREHYQIEKRYRRKDGRLIWVRFSVSLISSTAGLPRLQLALCEDITDRKLAEEALRKSEERSRTLLEINNAIITSLTEAALLQTVTEALGRVLPSDLAAVALYQHATQTFRFLAAESSLRSDYFKPGLEYKRKESIAGWVIDHQRAVVRNDLEKEQRYGNDRRLLEMGLKSDCIVPLIVRGKTIGTLNVASRTKNHFSAAHLEFLQEVGNQVALAVANMQAYEEITALKVRLEKENVYLKEEIRTEHNFEEIVGNSPPLLELLRQVDQVAPTDSSILIYGETGTGKELIARAIHNRSPRKNRPLVKVNCAAIAAGLVESELFGHMKGAFTGAFERRVGRFELADRGTIFLDEIGELPMDTQVKLLRVLQEREFEPVGSNRSVRVDVRIIAATNRNLQESVLGGRFRPDLFYRLNVFPLEIPALRDRPSDILPLAMFFLCQHSRKLGKRLDGISQAAKDRLASYPWPGNVRELQNVIERAAILARGARLELADLAGLSPSRVPQDTSRQAIATAPAALSMHSEQMTLDAVQRIHILAVLGQTGGVVEGPKGAAKALGLHPNTLRHRMEKLGIKRFSHHIS